MKKRIVIILIIILIFSATIATGIYLLKGKNNAPVPASTQSKTGSNFEIGKETVPRAPAKSATKVTAKSTKQIFASIPKQIQGRLVKIIFKKMPLGQNKNLTNTLIFVYYDDASKKTAEADYVFESGRFLKNPKPASAPANPETVSESAINFGYEGMRGILLASPEYVNYRTKYPQLLSNCAATLLKNSQYGWEWITACSTSVNGKKSSVTFSANIETKKVTVIKSENLE